MKKGTYLSFRVHQRQIDAKKIIKQEHFPLATLIEGGEKSRQGRANHGTNRQKSCVDNALSGGSPVALS